MTPPFSNKVKAFTLLEVVLAIGIAVGMLVVVLFFYQQTADLRAQLLQRTEQLSTARLLMDRITAELRTTRRHEYFQGAFIGESDFLQFIKTDIPSRVAWRSGALGRAATVETDLKLVRYSLNSSGGTNILGLARSEESLLEARSLRAASDLATSQSVSNSLPLLTEDIHFLRFRYWDGKSWQDSWRSSELPQGVEVSLGMEAFPPEAQPSEYPYEVFRRVIYLPGSSSEQQWAALSRSARNVSLAEVAQ